MGKENMVVQVAMTERCNLRCVQCDLWKAPEKRAEISSGQWLDIFIRLRKWIGRPYLLNIGGGEPFIRRDLADVIKSCSDNDIEVSVVTNATLLDERAISILAPLKNVTVNVSLDGALRETHDSLRGEGVYDKAVGALESFKAKDRKCFIKIASVIMSYNFREIPAILKELIVKRKLADWHIVQAVWVPDCSGAYGREWYKASAHWPVEDSQPELFSVIDELIDLKRREFPITNPVSQIKFFKNYFSRLDEFVVQTSCDIGDRNFIMNPSGKVLLCWNMDPVGDILTQEPEEILNSPAAQECRRRIRACRLPCRILNCNFDLEIDDKAGRGN